MPGKPFIPPVPLLSSRAFWDINQSSLDFERHATFIIIRVFERGSFEDKDAITTLYGKERIIQTLTGAPSLLPPAREWAKQIFGLADEHFISFTGVHTVRNLSGY